MRLALAALAGLAGTAHANVAANKGNAYVVDGALYVPAIDLAYGDGPEPELVRVYTNAPAGPPGMFGTGWGTLVETHVELTGDGTALLHLHGNGATLRFTADGRPARDDIGAEVDAIIAASPPRPGDEAIERARLRRDWPYRAERWRAMRVRGAVPAPAEPPVGAVLVDEHLATLARTPDGYAWRHAEGAMLFDRAGRFVRTGDDRHGLAVVTRDARGRIAALEDSVHRRIAFVYAGDRVASATTSDGKALAFRYDARDQLLHARDADGDEYDYGYDPGGRHQLVEIRYGDRTRLDVGYLSPRYGGSVAVVTEGASATVYAYLVDPRDDRHREVAVEVVHERGDVASRRRLATWLGERANGETFIARALATANGDVTDTTYDARCGLPARIVHGRDATAFTYDATCRLESKDEGSPPETIRTKFTYDTQARVVSASNTGHAAALTYDGAGRIATGTVDGVMLRFGYDGNGRLRELAVDGVGTLDPDSSDGGAIATAYRRLLGLLPPGPR